MFVRCGLSRGAAPLSARRLPTTCQVRSLYDVVRVPNGGDATPLEAKIKLLYPAVAETELSTPPDKTRAPFPVVLFFAGGFTDAFRYQWLGEALVEETGVAFLLFEVIREIFPGCRGPSSNLQLTVDGVGCTPLIEALLAHLAAANEERLLDGTLDLSRLVFGGHSFGGRDVLGNADAERFPHVKGAFLYAAHSAGGPGTGHPPATILDVKGSVPLLLMGGSADDTVTHAGPATFGTEWTCPMEPVRRTFHEALQPGRRAYCVEFEGFNHDCIVDPYDRTFGGGFKYSRSNLDPKIVQRAFARVIRLFVKETVFGDEGAASQLKRLAEDELARVRSVEWKI